MLQQISGKYFFFFAKGIDRKKNLKFSHFDSTNAHQTKRVTDQQRAAIEKRRSTVAVIFSFLLTQFNPFFRHKQLKMKPKKTINTKKMSTKCLSHVVGMVEHIPTEKKMKNDTHRFYIKRKLFCWLS